MIRQALRMTSLLLAAAAGYAGTSAAQEVAEVRVHVDNDNFNFWIAARDRTDHEYTHGSRVEIELRTSYAWSRAILGSHRACSPQEEGGDPCLITAWSLAQQIYTPRTNSERLVRRERPYAGWLGIGVATHRREANSQHSLFVELGTTGSPSLAEAAQTLIHEMGEWWMPLGWDHQLRFEPAVLIGYESRVRRAIERSGWGVEAVGGLAGYLGNLRTGFEPELRVRAGYRPAPAWPLPGATTGGFSMTLVAAVSTRVVLHDLFLDGTLLRPSHSVERIPLLPAHHLGLEMSYGRISGGLIAHTRSRSYATEPDGHSYTSLTVSVRPKSD